MQVLFASKSLERLCTDQREMRRRRADIAKKLPLRIKALEAAPTVGDLPAWDPSGKWHRLTQDRSGTWAAWVSRNHRIVVRPEGEGLDVDAVTVTVLDAGEDYH